jgi:hypothetical protein
MAVAKKAPAKKAASKKPAWTMAKDDKADKKAGIRENSAKDKKLDAKRGLKK